MTVVNELEVLLTPWRFPATFGAEGLEFGFDTGVVTGCFGTEAVETVAWVPLAVVFEALPCVGLPLDVLFAAALACTASS